jgi:hypothetical protein
MIFLASLTVFLAALWSAFFFLTGADGSEWWFVPTVITHAIFGGTAAIFMFVALVSGDLG